MVTHYARKQPYLCFVKHFRMLEKMSGSIESRAGEELPDFRSGISPRDSAGIPCFFRRPMKKLLSTLLALTAALGFQVQAADEKTEAHSQGQCTRQEATLKLQRPEAEEQASLKNQRKALDKQLLQCKGRGFILVNRLWPEKIGARKASAATPGARRITHMATELHFMDSRVPAEDPESLGPPAA